MDEQLRHEPTRDSTSTDAGAGGARTIAPLGVLAGIAVPHGVLARPYRSGGDRAHPHAGYPGEHRLRDALSFPDRLPVDRLHATARGLALARVRRRHSDPAVAAGTRDSRSVVGAPAHRTDVRQGVAPFRSA